MSDFILSNLVALIVGIISGIISSIIVSKVFYNIQQKKDERDYIQKLSRYIGEIEIEIKYYSGNKKDLLKVIELAPWIDNIKLNDGKKQASSSLRSLEYNLQQELENRFKNENKLRQELENELKKEVANGMKKELENKLKKQLKDDLEKELEETKLSLNNFLPELRRIKIEVLKTKQ